MSQDRSTLDKTEAAFEEKKLFLAVNTVLHVVASFQHYQCLPSKDFKFQVEGGPGAKPPNSLRSCQRVASCQAPCSWSPPPTRRQIEGPLIILAALAPSSGLARLS